MPVTSTHSDPDALTLTVVADFAAPLARLWDAHVDPRQLERFWGPPTWPATFVRHDAIAGGRSHYWLTGPEGQRADAYWEWISVDSPHGFVVRQGFADSDGRADADGSTSEMRFSFDSTAAGSRLTIVTQFPSVATMRRMLEMQMAEGLTQAIGQVDAILTGPDTFAVEAGTHCQLIGETHARISRVIAGPVDAVWRAHHDPDLVRRWMLGPDGWSMPVCEIAAQIGETFRYEWEQADQRFGFIGELLERDAPHREVSTERMIGSDGPETVGELTLRTLETGTLLCLVIAYPDAGTRAAILGTGMVRGMEASYRRLEEAVLAPA